MKLYRNLILFAFIFGIILTVVAAQDVDDLEEESTSETVVHNFPKGRNQVSLDGDGSSSTDSTSKPKKFKTRLDLKTLTVEDVWFEIIAISFLAIYGLQFTRGKSQNSALALRWMRNTLEKWQDHFAHIGATTGHKLVRDGPKDYIFYATGRTFVSKMYAFIRLIPRNDLAMYLYNTFVSGKDLKDVVELEATLNQNQVDSFIFAILPKYKASLLQKARWDLDNVPKTRDIPGFPKDHYVLLTDAPEFAATFWQEPRIKELVYKSIGLDAEGKGTPILTPLIHELVLSDLPSQDPLNLDELRNEPLKLSLTFDLPETSKNNRSADGSYIMTENDFVDLFMDTIDCVGQLGRLSADAKQRVKRIRIAAEEVILKAEALKRKEELEQKKIAEKKAREEQIAKLSPEEQRKYEEKERKRELKKTQSKAMKRGKVVKM